MASTFGVSVEEIPDEARSGAFANWDSLSHLELMLALEGEFGVRISTQEMLDLQSLEAIEAFLQKNGVAA
jgi:acyl carrier protein